jgi:acetyl esterase/lipase
MTGAALDAVSARPDFLILLYPVITMKDPYAHAGSRTNLIGKTPTPELIDEMSLDQQVTKDTPPTFLAHTQADRTVPVENSLMFYAALRKAGVPAELHLWPKGGHGFGMRSDVGEASTWSDRCEEWMRANGWLDAPKPAVK